MHNLWTVSDPMQRSNEQAHFLKDLALAGTAFVLFAVFTQDGPLGPALTDLKP